MGSGYLILKLRTIMTYVSLFIIFEVSPSIARPNGPSALCEVWSSTVYCDEAMLTCTTCHTAPPARDDFGQVIEAALWPGDERPESDDDFLAQGHDKMASG